MIIKYTDETASITSTAEYQTIYNELQKLYSGPKRELSTFLLSINPIELATRLIYEYSTKSNEDMVENPTLIEDIVSDYFLSREELFELAEAYPETIGRAMVFANSKQKTMLIKNGLTGKWNSKFTIFTATNLTDMKLKSYSENKTINSADILRRIEEEQEKAIVVDNASYEIMKDKPLKGEVKPKNISLKK